MIFVYITCKDTEQAKSIAKQLLEKKYIACANIFPIESVYKWNNEIKEESEVVLICKTNNSRYDFIKEEVEKIHSYDTPCIVKIDAKANEAFAKWVHDEVQ